MKPNRTARFVESNLDWLVPFEPEQDPSQDKSIPGPIPEQEDEYEPATQQRAAGGRVSVENIDHNPSEGQKRAGTYKKDKIHILGLTVTIENAKGKPRSGVGPDGVPWKVIMPSHYGYVNGSVGADKDHVDVYVGPHIKSPHVFIIDQLNAETGEFDETKSMIGFASEKQALNTYLKGFSDGKGPQRFGAMRKMSKEEFKDWVFSPKAKKPIAL